MMDRSKHISKIRYCWLIILAVAVAVNFNFTVPTARADALSDLQNQLKALQNQKKKNTAAIEQKQREIDNLKQQITSVNSQIDNTESAITSTEKQISNTNSAISDLEKEIAKQQSMLDAQQESMSKVLSSWYMEGDSSLLEAMIASDNISEMINKQQYYESVRRQVETTIEGIRQIKDDLSDQKTAKERKLAELSDLRSSQSNQKIYLEGRKALKNQLLSNSTSAVTNLQEEQKETESMISSLQVKIDRIRAASIGSGGDLVSAPDASWYFRQDDSRWSSYRMGNYATIGLYGCLLTSLTMIANYYGSSYTPMTAAGNSAFVHGGYNDGALISTSIVRDGGSQPINWNVVDEQLAANHPVVVGVALGVDMGNSYGVSHFVVVKSKLGSGKYAIQDPLGENRGYAKSQVKAMRIVRP